MSGTPLDEFTTFVASQGAAWASGPQDIVNEAILHTYTGPRLAAGKSHVEMIQAGSEIKDTIYFDEQDTWERYNPNVQFSPQMPQTGVQWTVPWAFAAAHIAWTKHEIGLNKDTTTKKYRAQRYKEVLFQKKQNLWTNICNSMEAEYWAQPDQVNMESSSPSSPRVPYSLPVFNNEYQDGLPVGDNITDWTTVMGIAPGTYPKWAPQLEGYAYNASSNTTGIFSSFSRIFHRLRFDRLPKRPEYSDKTTSPHVIFTQLQGLINYEHALRVNQDEFRGMGAMSGQDPAYSGPTFRGIPVEYIDQLDSAEIYPTGTDAAALADVNMSTWDDATNDTGTDVTNPQGETVNVGWVGPRYHFFNCEYLKCLVHAENYLAPTEVFTPPTQPFTRIQYFDLWNNLIVKSRMRHGTVAPDGADVVSV